MEPNLLLLITIGSCLIVATVMLQVLFTSVAIAALTRAGNWLVLPPLFTKTTISLVAVVLWLLAGISISAWLWAGVFLLVEAFQTLEPALYFSIVTLTTLGYGDITLSPQWRLLGSLTAVNGLIIFGLNTAFLVEFYGRLRSAQESAMSNSKTEV